LRFSGRASLSTTEEEVLEEGGAAPGKGFVCLAAPKPSTIYRRRRREGAAPRVPTLGLAAALDGPRGGGQERERGGRSPRWALGPICSRVCPPPPLCCALGPCGGRTSPPRGWFPSTCGPCSLLGLVAPLGGPRNPSGGPGTLPVNPETLPVAKSSLPIYHSLPPDHSGTPRDVRDLIRDSEQLSVNHIQFPLQL
jgi:hypothetical protein